MTALLARLVPVLRGGGLWGLGNYDDGVYYAAGTALTHGLWPYRDFVLLHPPGVVLLLAPFGLLSRITGDPSAFAAARLTWMALGALNAVLVARIVRPAGLLAAALGALLYALSYPTLYTEYTTLLEAPAQTCVLLALLLLAPRLDAQTLPRVPCLVAGALLGASATFKIWGVVAVVAVVVWFLACRSWRVALQVLAGAAAGITVICLPFFAAAPTAMWRMVVLDQLNRNQTHRSTAVRLAGIVGLGLHQPAIHRLTPLLIAVLGLMAVLLCVALTVPAARLSVVLTGALSTLLLVSPSWFLHYPGLVGGPLSVGLAIGAAEVVRRAGNLRSFLGPVAAVLVLGLLLAEAYPLTSLHLGRRFPGQTLARSVAGTTGCITADDPVALVELNVLTRNLDRHCAFVADLGGYSYELERQGVTAARPRNRPWQRIYLDYLRTGTIALSFRFADNGDLSGETRSTIQHWSPSAQAGPFVLRAVPAPP